MTLDAELRRLQEHAIIESSAKSDEMQFRHALIQEISYRSVLRADRVRVHGVVGETLIASGRAEAQPEIAAYHLGAAGRATRSGAALEAGFARGTTERPLPGGRGS